MLPYSQYFKFAIFIFCLIGHHSHADVDPAVIEHNPAAKKALQLKAAPHFLNHLKSGNKKNGVIVLYRDSQNLQLPSPSRATDLKIKKNRSNIKMRAGDFRIEHDYDQLPMQALTIDTSESLAALLADSDVLAVYNDEPLELHLAESLPLIKEEAALTRGSANAGLGSTVAVLDSGVNFTQAAFGHCTAAGQPATCKVSAAIDIAANDGQLDSTGHGTNVAAIVLGVAPAAKIVALDVMNGTNISTSDTIAAINWVMANRAAYHIVAINMSLGGGTPSASPCSFGNAFVSPIAAAKSMGIAVIASSGNGGVSTGISSPACTPGVISVGAIYDSNQGGLNWGICTDYETKVDQVACFSNSASYLSILAPGVFITAAAETLSGTSQAAPHVSGAMALLSSAFPNENLTDLEARLKTSNTQIKDARNNALVPRLDLQAALAVAYVPADEIPFMPTWALALFVCTLLFLGMRGSYFGVVAKSK